MRGRPGLTWLDDFQEEDDVRNMLMRKWRRKAEKTKVLSRAVVSRRK